MAWLDDPQRKLARAEKHLRELESAMQKELDATEHTVTQRARTTLRADGGTETILDGLVFEDPPELPRDWALLIGDFAANARAALDHLAWQLAGRNTWHASRAINQGKAWPPDNTYFPIVAELGTSSNRAFLKKRLTAFRPSDRKLVAAEQPHRRPRRAREQPLWLLNAIRNTDAHRELHSVLAAIPASAVAELHRLVPSSEAGQEFYWPQQLREALVPVIAGANPGDTVETTLRLQGEFSPYVTFLQPGTDFDGLEVLPLLERCRGEVERIINVFPA